MKLRTEAVDLALEEAKINYARQFVWDVVESLVSNGLLPAHQTTSTEGTEFLLRVQKTEPNFGQVNSFLRSIGFELVSTFADYQEYCLSQPEKILSKEE